MNGWFIKLGKLRWAGHVIRMEEGEVARRVLKDEIHSLRKIGRPKATWIDGVAADAGSLFGVPNWMAAAQNRDAWRRLIEEAQTH